MTSNEKTLEDGFVHRLVTELGYLSPVSATSSTAEIFDLIVDRVARLNRRVIGKESFSDGEASRLISQLHADSVYDAGGLLRSKVTVEMDDGRKIDVRLIDFKSPGNNIFEVRRQVHALVSGQRKAQQIYDVMLLCNGFPIVHVELKRNGAKESAAFHQIQRYQKKSSGRPWVFNYTQLFVTSNGSSTYYFANMDEPLNKKYHFRWTDESNQRIPGLNGFSDTVLRQDFLLEIIRNAMIYQRDRTIKVARPYQIHASNAIINSALSPNARSNGYICHSTGSGKTLTSYMVAARLSRDSRIRQVVMLVDRTELDAQTGWEFNNFSEGFVDSTPDIKNLKKKLSDPGNSFIITTINKMSEVVRSNSTFDRDYPDEFGDRRVVFIVDECHRTQFGKMHDKIKGYFPDAQFFGFTGTPRFSENAGTGGRVTADVFGEMLHTYLMKDAIVDKNVLLLRNEYFLPHLDGMDGEPEAARLSHPKRMDAIVDHILKNYRRVTYKRRFNAMFATDSIEQAVNYYHLLQSGSKGGVKITALFTIDPNRALKDQSLLVEHQEIIVRNYNEMFNTQFTAQTHSIYKADVMRRFKNREIDLLIVVDQLLTGFDSPRTAALYVDKNLRDHGFIQAISRVNRVFDESKTRGNLVFYRDLKQVADDALELFNTTNHPRAAEGVFVDDYEDVSLRLTEALEALRDVTPNPDDAAQLRSESEKETFIQAFREFSRAYNDARLYPEFEEEEEEAIGISEEEVKSYLVHYREIREMSETPTQEWDDEDLDVVMSLIGEDVVDYDYIMNLIASTLDETDTLQEAEAALDALEPVLVLASLPEDVPTTRAAVQFAREQVRRDINYKTINLRRDFERAQEDRRMNDIETFAAKNQLDVDLLQSAVDEHALDSRETTLGRLARQFTEGRGGVSEKKALREKIEKFIKATKRRTTP